MDDRFSRFKFCDSWLYPYLDKVLSRLPKKLREEILNNDGFQIISDAVLSDICGQCLHFHQPIEFLIYLNPALEMQPDIRISCSIATELANYIAIKEQWGGDEERIQKLLIQWGFENEVNAACFCNAVAGSKIYKSGYEWARKHSEDYLMLHYGIYYDEWNSTGLKRIPKAQMEILRTQVGKKHLLPNSAKQEEKNLPEGISLDEVFIEGIMVAVKEMKLQNK